MCKYCEMKNPLDNMISWLGRKSMNLGDLTNFLDLNLYIDIPDRRIGCELTSEDALVATAVEVDINYCPMCGRKLRDI